jgi:hypothetical protein
MTQRIVLDTTVLIDALRGYPAVDRIRSLRGSNSQLWVTPISIEEIWRGLRPGEEDATDRLVNALRLTPFDRTVARTAGSWHRQYAANGVTLHQADCLIAAATHRVNGRLATGNPADFPMSEVVVEYWSVGE